MVRKRSHQAFTDLQAQEPLSPVLRPPRQEMGSGESGSDSDEVMGTGDASFLSCSSSVHGMHSDWMVSCCITLAIAFEACCHE